MNKKVSKKWLSLLMAVVMVLSLVPGTVIAAETAPDKHGTATVTLMNEKKDKLSMYDPILDAKADITVSGGNVTVKLLVVSPLPSHPDQSADGTMTNVRVHYDGVEYDTVSAVGTGAIMTAKATDSIFGIKAGEQYTAQVLTVTLPEAAVTEGARLYIKAYISAIMSTEAVFRLAFSDLTWDEAGTADPDAEAAAAVDAMIADIGEVTLDSGTAITEARAAYDDLTDAQKALVKNLAVLTAAEAKLAELKKPEQLNTPRPVWFSPAAGQVAVNTPISMQSWYSTEIYYCFTESTAPMTAQAIIEQGRKFDPEALPEVTGAVTIQAVGVNVGKTRSEIGPVSVASYVIGTPIRERMEAKLAEVEALTPTDYTLESWLNVQEIVTDINRNLIPNDQTMNSSGESYLVRLQAAIDALEPAGEKVPVVLEDGMYSVPVRGFYGFDRDKNEYTPVNHMLAPDALLRVENGKAEITVRMTGYALMEKVFVLDQQYMTDYEYSGNYRFYVPNASEISDDNPAKAKWVDWEQLSAEDNHYYLPQSSLSVENNETMGYADLTFPLTDLALDTVLWMYPINVPNETFSEQSQTMVLDIDETRIKALDPLPENGTYTWVPVVNDGAIHNAGNPEDTAALQSFFGTEAEARVTDGTAVVKIPVVNEEVNFAGVMTRMSTTIYLNQFNRKNDWTSDYQDVLADGVMTLTCDVSNYKDIVFGQRIRVVLPGEPVYNYSYYGGMTFNTAATRLLELTNEATGVQYLTDTLNVPGTAVLEARQVDEDHGAYDQLQARYTPYKRYVAFDISVQNNGTAVSTTRNGTLRLPLPEGWDQDQLVLEQVYADGTVGHGPAFRIVDGYMEFATADMGVWIIAEKYRCDAEAPAANGTYSVPAVTWNMTTDYPSMSTNAILSPATLVVRDGVKTLYLELQDVEVSGLNAYMGNMWVYDKDTVINEHGYPVGDTYAVTTYQYQTNEDGSFLRDDLNPEGLNFYPKNLYFTLPSDQGELPVRFNIPIMDAIGGGDMSRDARLRLDYSSAVKISDETPDVPVKAALSQQIAIADLAVEANYAEAAWTAADAAKKNAQALVDDPNASVDEMNQALDALRTAIAGLVKLTPDEKAAADVSAKIADIGEVTLRTEGLITEARAAYDDLTDAQKALVKNLAVLEAAEARLAELQTPAAQVVAESAALRAEKQASADGKAPFTLSLNKPRNISVIKVTFAADADVSVEGLNGFSVVGVKNSVATLVYTADGQLSADGAVDVVRFNVAAEGDTTMRVTDLVIAGRDANETAVYGKITGAIDPNEAVFISNIYDLNKDEIVDLLDLVVAQEFYQATAESDVWTDAVKCDFDHSGVIDIADYIDLCSHFTQPR